MSSTMVMTFLRRALGSGAVRLPAAGALAAIGIAGCGGSTPAPAPRRSAAASPTSTAAPSVPRDPGALRDQEAAIHAQVMRSLHQLRYGNVRYVPPPLEGRPHDTVVLATPAHPALAIQGDGIRLAPRGGNAVATLTGPAIPANLEGTNTAHTPVRFTLTLQATDGRIPLRASDFSIVDELGHLHRPALSIGAHPAPPAASAGQRLHITLTSMLPPGDGELRYSPAGRHWLADWSFTVETD